MKLRKQGFTLIELLVVLSIIALLVAVLLPSLRMVRNFTKEAKQKSQFATIETTLLEYRSDFGDYPPSVWVPGDNYCGAQKLAEALLGQDLMGCHPESRFTYPAGNDRFGNPLYPAPLDLTIPAHQANLRARRGPYLDSKAANAFKLMDLYDGAGPYSYTSVGLEGNTYVLCDSFAVKKVTLTAGSRVINLKAGTPILYYRADPTKKAFARPSYPDQRIYNAFDNIALANLRITADQTTDHPLGSDIENFYKFDAEGGVKDSRVTSIAWPHRPDSYILISAGVDGLYGTGDDITNF